MAFRKVAVEGVPLSRRLAHRFATMTPVPGERDLKPKRLTDIANWLAEGKFAGPTWVYGVDLRTQREYRLDGQHTSKYLNGLSDDQFPFDLLVTVERYEFDSIEDDGDDLFSKFDTPVSTRTNEDVIGRYRATVEDADVEALPRRFLMRAMDGLAEYEKSLDDGKPLAPRERGAYLRHKPYQSFVKWLGTFQTARNATFLKKPGIVAEMVADFIQSPDCAREFWDFVLRENHPDADHETRKLAMTFRDWIYNRKHKAQDYRARAAKMWRLFRLGFQQKRNAA